MRAYYSATFADFIASEPNSIIGALAANTTQDLARLQTNAWENQIQILQNVLKDFQDGFIYFEMLVPRMGKRVDSVLVIDGIIFVLEFKIGESNFHQSDIRQVESYALDLSHFHETSHDKLIIPILIATDAHAEEISLDTLDFFEEFGVLKPFKTNSTKLADLIKKCLIHFNEVPKINSEEWFIGQYKPTPTILEAAKALYSNHDVRDIFRNDAGAINITETTAKIDEIISTAQINHKKIICFVTGVPGAGKTLVGLNVATNHSDPSDDKHAVFLSGNGPLVEVLREALAQDSHKRTNITIDNARRKTSTFIQNIHHFRDDNLNEINPPIDKVVIFDEAQRAWNKEKLAKFMRQKRNQQGFDQSEPEFLIDVMNRHAGWCVIIALIGGGQEINDGEAGLTGWIDALVQDFPDWDVFYSEQVNQIEYIGNQINIGELNIQRNRAMSVPSLHLSTSMRSFRAEYLSHFIYYLINNQPDEANAIYRLISEKFPIFITRDLSQAKSWVTSKVRGLETCGFLASSGAKRLKGEGLYVNNTVSASDWFLKPHDDVRSSNFLEDIGTEFLVQGLELDWCIFAWDADFRYQSNQFQHWKFRGTKWQNILSDSQKKYLQNSYRVLLTRARQGMIIFVPKGSPDDLTRLPSFYDETFDYLKACGLLELQ